MIKQILLLSIVSFSCSSLSAQEVPDSTSTKNAVLIRSGNKTVFGSEQAALTNYLNNQRIVKDDAISFKRAVFKLYIDHSGKVVEASRHVGGITPDLEAAFMKAFLEMPSWTTDIEQGQQSVVFIEVTVRKQEVSTQLY